MTKSRLLVIVALTLFLGKFAFALGIDSSNTTVDFLAKGFPSALKIKGKLEKNKALEGELIKSDSSWSLSANCTLENFETGIGLRDQHMREKYLEVSLYPTAVLHVKEALLSEENFRGELSLHGVKKFISGKVKWDGESAHIEFPIRLSDFNIAIPSFMGITVAEEVFVSAQIEGLQ